MSVSCTVSSSNDCDEKCVDDFYQTPCSHPCKQSFGTISLHCPENSRCYILGENPSYLGNTTGICNKIDATDTHISMECGPRDILKIKTWIESKHSMCNSVTPSTAHCICNICDKYDTTLKCSLDQVYCSCKADNKLETSPPLSTVSTTKLVTSPEIMTSAITSADITTSDITSSDVQTTITYTAPPISHAPMAVKSSDKSGVTGAAAGGAVGLLLIAVVILFALWFRNRRLKKSNDRHINTPPSLDKQIYNAHNGSLVPPPDETYAVPRDYDYTNHGTTQRASYETTAGENQANDYEMAKPEPEENYLNLTEVTRNQERDIKGSTNFIYENETRLSQRQVDDVSGIHGGNVFTTINLEQPVSDNVYENSLSLPHLQSEQNDQSNTMSDEVDYNVLNQGAGKILDQCDDQYQHVKNTRNSSGQDDYDELAKPFERQENNSIEDSYDHCKIPSPKYDENDEDSYDHLN